MLLLLCIILVLVGGIMLLIHCDDIWLIFGGCLMGLGVCFVFGYCASAVENHNYDFNEVYQKQKCLYEFVLKQDTIPFEVKKQLYDDCKTFNEKLELATNLHDDAWVGWMFQNPDTTKLKQFDLSRIQ